MGSVIKMQGKPRDLPDISAFGDLIEGYLHGLGYKDFDLLVLLECIDVADDDAMELESILDMVQHYIAGWKEATWPERLMAGFLIGFFTDGLVHDFEQKVVPICSHVFGENTEAIHAATRALASSVMQKQPLGASTFAAAPESDYDMGMQFAAMAQTAQLNTIY